MMLLAFSGSPRPGRAVGQLLRAAPVRGCPVGVLSALPSETGGEKAPAGLLGALAARRAAAVATLAAAAAVA